MGGFGTQGEKSRGRYPFTEGWWAWEYDMESFMSTLKRNQFGKG